MHESRGYYIPKHIIYVTNVSIHTLPILWEWMRASTLGNSVSFQQKSGILLCIKIIHYWNKLSPNRARNAHSPWTQRWGKLFKFTYSLANGATLCYLRHILQRSWTEIKKKTVSKVIPMLFINSRELRLIYILIHALFYGFLWLNNIQATSNPCLFNAFCFNAKVLSHPFLNCQSQLQTQILSYMN